MDNPIFVDDENIQLVHDEDIDYDDYNTPNTSKVDKTSFTMPGSTDKETHLTVKTKSKTRKPHRIV